jgi:cbb3-type cytochrome oxidase maturation protein
MEVIYGLIPGMILLGLGAVIVLFWAARSGQFDDLEGDGQRILMDEDAVDPRRIPDAEGMPECREEGRQKNRRLSPYAAIHPSRRRQAPGAGPASGQEHGVDGDSIQYPAMGWTEPKHLRVPIGPCGFHGRQAEQRFSELSLNGPGPSLHDFRVPADRDNGWPWTRAGPGHQGSHRDRDGRADQCGRCRGPGC